MSSPPSNVSDFPIELENSRKGSFDSKEGCPKTPVKEERLEIAQLSRGLRRVKRELFLKQVEGGSFTPPLSPRDILMKAAIASSTPTGTSPSRKQHVLTDVSGIPPMP